MEDSFGENCRRFTNTQIELNKRILLVTSEFPPGPGGIGHHAYCLAKELNKSSEVIVLTSGDYASAQELLHFDNNQKFRIHRFRRFGLLTQLWRIVNFLMLIITKRPQKIIYSGLFPIWMVNFGKTFLFRNAKHIAIVHGHEPIFGSNSKKKLTAYSLKKFDKIFPVSKFSQQNTLKAVGVNTIRFIKVVPNGLDLEELSSWKAKCLLQKTNLVKMERGFPKLLTVGHTSPRKGQHNVIRALPQILKKYPDTYYYIVGRDVNNSYLTQLTEELKVADRVVFIPPIANHFDLAYYYKNADILMLLSENQIIGDVEGFGIVALEANYFGLPVIGARGCGIEDAINDGYNGFLVDNKDCDEITEKTVQTILNMGNLRIQCQKWVLNFDWKKIGRVYNELIK